MIVFYVFFFSTYFRCDVIGCAAEGLRGFITCNAFFAHSEIRYFNMPVLIQQHVIQLQIPVYNPSTVQKEQSDGNFRGVKSEINSRMSTSRILWKNPYLHSDRLFEFSTLLNLEHQIASVDVFHYEVQTILFRNKISFEKILSGAYSPWFGSRNGVELGMGVCWITPARVSLPWYTRRRHPE